MWANFFGAAYGGRTPPASAFREWCRIPALCFRPCSLPPTEDLWLKQSKPSALQTGVETVLG
jgi:hypothetical protein